MGEEVAERAGVGQSLHLPGDDIAAWRGGGMVAGFDDLEAPGRDGFLQFPDRHEMHIGRLSDPLDERQDHPDEPVFERRSRA